MSPLLPSLRRLHRPRRRLTQAQVRPDQAAQILGVLFQAKLRDPRMNERTIFFRKIDGNSKHFSAREYYWVASVRNRFFQKKLAAVRGTVQHFLSQSTSVIHPIYNPQKPTMKASTSKKQRVAPAALTSDEASEVHTLIMAVAESFAGGATPAEKRWRKKLLALAAKIRRLY